MSDLNTQFEAAAARVQKLTKLGNDEKLRFYGLYKQGTGGDVQSKRPGMLDMVGAAKWDAWKARAGMPPDEAKRAYVLAVEQITGTAVASTTTSSSNSPPPATTTTTSAPTDGSHGGDGDDGARRSDGGFGGMGNSVSTFSGCQPNLDDSPATLTSNRTRRVRASLSACFCSSEPKSRLSTL